MIEDIELDFRVDNVDWEEVVDETFEDVLIVDGDNTIDKICDIVKGCDKKYQSIVGHQDWQWTKIDSDVFLDDKPFNIVSLYKLS